MRILVVCDGGVTKAGIALLVTKALEAASVASGAAALNELQQSAACAQPYALVLIDAVMPGMDGLTLAQEIARHPELRLNA